MVGKGTTIRAAHRKGLSAVSATVEAARPQQASLGNGLLVGKDFGDTVEAAPPLIGLGNCFLMVNGFGDSIEATPTSRPCQRPALVQRLRRHRRGCTTTSRPWPLLPRGQRLFGDTVKAISRPWQRPARGQRPRRHTRGCQSASATARSVIHTLDGATYNLIGIGTGPHALVGSSIDTLDGAASTLSGIGTCPTPLVGSDISTVDGAA